MKHPILKPYIVLFSVVSLFSACAGPAENTATSNSNSSQQGNNNSQPAVAESAPAPSPGSGTPLSVQPIPAPSASPLSSATPPVKPPAAVNANTAKPAIVPGAAAPKLVAPAKKLEFGKQPQDKTLIRAITIKNGGRANLNIESVTPS